MGWLTFLAGYGYWNPKIPNAQPPEPPEKPTKTFSIVNFIIGAIVGSFFGCIIVLRWNRRTPGYDASTMMFNYPSNLIIIVVSIAFGIWGGFRRSVFR